MNVELGFSIVHNVVLESNGHIIVDTSKDGTTFNVLFRIAAGDIKQSNTTTDSQPASISANKAVNTNKHIMIVNDENSIAAYLGELFIQPMLSILSTAISEN